MAYVPKIAAPSHEARTLACSCQALIRHLDPASKGTGSEGTLPGGALPGDTVSGDGTSKQRSAAPDAPSASPLGSFVDEASQVAVGDLIDFWDRIWGEDHLLYEKAIRTLHTAIEKANCSTWDYYVWSIGDCYISTDTVQAVLNCYIGLAGTGQIPEWDETLPPGQDPNRPKVTLAVSQCAAQTQRIVWDVLHALWKCTWSREIPSFKLLRPKTSNAFREIREETPEPYNPKVPLANMTFGQIVNTTIDIVKWTAILAGVGTLGFFGWKAYTAIKS